MSIRVCRWGFLSTATIGRKNWLAIRHAGNATVAAVASRNRQNAVQFVQECESRWPLKPSPRVYGHYQELLNDPEIDAVYVPLPTGLRKEWVIRAADAGKHVLCEKPCAVSAADLRDMLAACERNRVQFMDGVMFMHSRRLRQLQQALDDAHTFGELKRIGLQFSFAAPDDFFRENIRVDRRLEPQGCLGDLGWYTIRLALWARGFELPERVSGRMLSRTPGASIEHAVPLEFSGELFFRGGVSASFYNSFQTHHQQWAQFSGTKSQIRIADFVLPYFGSAVSFEEVTCEFNPTGWDFNMEPHRRYVEVAEHSNAAANSAESLLFRTFSNLVLEGTRESHWPEIALQTQIVLDACLESARRGGTLIELTDRPPITL